MRTAKRVVRILALDANRLAYPYSYLAEVYFIEYHLVGMADAPEAGDESQDGDHSQSKLIVPFSLYCLFRDTLELLDRILSVHGWCCFCVSRAALSSSLADSAGGHIWRIRACRAQLVKEGEMKKEQESGRRPQRSGVACRCGHVQLEMFPRTRGSS
jgi:hypothetical protein